jgi:hypothetical protein
MDQPRRELPCSRARRRQEGSRHGKTEGQQGNPQAQAAEGREDRKRFLVGADGPSDDAGQAAIGKALHVAQCSRAGLVKVSENRERDEHQPERAARDYDLGGNVQLAISISA